MANVTSIELGGSITVTNAAAQPNNPTLTFANVNDRAVRKQRGTLINKKGAGGAGGRLYVGFNKPISAADESDQDGKVWIEDGGSIRVPKECISLYLQAATNSVVVHYIAD